MSKDIDTNMKIRKELNDLDAVLSMVYGNYSPSEVQRDYLMNYFYVLTFSNKTNYLIENAYANIGNEELKRFYINSYITKVTLVSLIVVNDLYIKLSHDFVTGRLNNENNKLFNMIVKAMDNGETTLLLSNIKFINQFIEASRSFIDATAYEKISLLSSLDEDDILRLSKFNPFFKEEYDHYNVTLDSEFFIRQISKWLNGKKDLNIALEKTAEFIIDICYTDSDRIDAFIDVLMALSDKPSDLEEALSTGDIEVIKPILNSFYQDNRDKILKR